MFVGIKFMFMKKLSTLFTLFILLTAFTCENEPLEGEFINENNIDVSDANPNLVGSWILIDMNADILSTSNFQGFNFTSEFSVEIVESDYILTFGETNYTVEGDYELMVSTTVEDETTSYSDSYTNVDGFGTYSTNGNTMTVDGSFIEFDFEGMPMEVDQGEQTVEYSLSVDGQTLTFNQDDVQSTNEGGVNASTTTTSTSVWQRLN